MLRYIELIHKKTKAEFTQLWCVLILLLMDRGAIVSYLHERASVALYVVIAIVFLAASCNGRVASKKIREFRSNTLL